MKESYFCDFFFGRKRRKKAREDSIMLCMLLIITSLAISDTIICLTRLPESIYFNMAGNYKNPYMPTVGVLQTMYSMSYTAYFA